MKIKRKKPLTDQEFKYIYSKVPRLCVEVVIKNKDKWLLTLRESDGWKGLWHIPGGTVFYKETLKDTAKRIALEELGLKINPKQILGEIYYPSASQMGGLGWSIGIAILCEPESEKELEEILGDKIALFKEIPEKTITEQKEFLKNHISKV
jgi:ADP-ribose pyrophosphatase YjhB (NUDIX family)